MSIETLVNLNLKDNKNAEELRHLIKNSPEILKKANHQGVTLLHAAIRDENMELAILIIRKGASLDAKDKKGNTPLHYAFLQKHWMLAKILAFHGADARIVNNNFEFPCALDETSEWQAHFSSELFKAIPKAYNPNNPLLNPYIKTQLPFTAYLSEDHFCASTETSVDISHEENKQKSEQQQISLFNRVTTRALEILYATGNRLWGSSSLVQNTGVQFESSHCDSTAQSIETKRNAEKQAQNDFIFINPLQESEITEMEKIALRLYLVKGEFILEQPKLLLNSALQTMSEQPAQVANVGNSILTRFNGLPSAISEIASLYMQPDNRAAIKPSDTDL